MEESLGYHHRSEDEIEIGGSGIVSSICAGLDGRVECVVIERDA